MKNDSNPYFSVIITTYNRKDFISLAIQSVLNQTYKDFELIVIDDGSTDGTSELVSKFADRRIVYRYRENKGVSSARNMGLKLSNGRYIAFLDSDDRWVKEKLEITSRYIKRYPDVKIFHTEEIWYRNGRHLNQKKKHKKPDGYVFFNSLTICCIGMSTAVVARELFDNVGVFDESLPACEDYDFWLRSTLKYRVKLIPECLTIKDGGRPDQLSSMHSLDKYRIYSLGKMLSNDTLNEEEYKIAREQLVSKCRIFSKGAEKRGKIEEAKYYAALPNRY